MGEFRGTHWSKMPNAEEIKKRLSEAKKGKRPAHLIGYSPSDETRKKMSEWQKGKKKKPFTDEHKKHMSEVRIGKARSEETKINISKAKKGKPSTKKRMYAFGRSYLQIENSR